MSQAEKSAEITAILIRACGLLTAEVFTPALFICSLSNLSKNAEGSLTQKFEEQVLLTRSEQAQELHNYPSVLRALPKRHFFPSFHHIDDLRPNN